jgi:hypothetical protein
MGARRDAAGDLAQMELHGLGVAERQDPGGALALLGTDRTEQVGPLGALVVGGARPGSLSGLAIGQLVLLSDAHLVLKPNL